MGSLLRFAVLASLVAASASTTYAGWGHRIGHHHAGYVPYGYAPAGYSQPGYFQSGGSISQLIFGDQQPTIVFDGGSLLGGLGVDFELVDGGGGDGGGELLPVRTIRTVRTYSGDSSRTLRLVRASELDFLAGEDEDEEACEDVRDKLDELKDDMNELKSSVKELKRLIAAAHDLPADEPDDAADLPGGEVGELMEP